jgi:hypothetical protein
MSLFNTATNAITTINNTLSTSGPASALSGISDNLSGTVKSVSDFLQHLTGVTELPLPNVLSSYATYNYIISIAVLTDEQLNFPDKSYIAGARLPLICKTAGADPTNRIHTAYGQFEFYVDNLIIEATVGFLGNRNTTVTNISFDVIEPYSMGIFMLVLQQAAYESGHKNWRDAPFLLTIDFRGNTQNGMLVKVPNATRYIPFRFQNLQIKSSITGTHYNVSAFAIQGTALTIQHASLKNDTSIKGTTVQEALQTGSKSLQSVVNARLQQYKTDGIVAVADEILILFPQDVASDANPASSPDNIESKSTATVDPKVDPVSSLLSKLGVTRSNVNQTLIQSNGQCNALGSASLGFSVERKGDTPISDDNVVYDAGTYIRANLKIDYKESNFKFSQDTSIPDAINQIIISSSYPNECLDPSKLDKYGMRDWWRIDTNVYNISSDDNMSKVGTKPRLIVYRVVPYKAHSSKITAPNVKAPGFDQIKAEVIKRYDYIYTGKNTEVLRFDIDFSSNFSTVMSADNFKRSQDVQQENQLGGQSKITNNSLGTISFNSFSAFAESALAFLKPLIDGSFPSDDLGVTPTQVKFTGTKTTTDKNGGGGTETEATRAARVFHDAITNGLDMVILDMDIVGDPFWIAQSGQGNYTSKPTQYKDLNADGTVNYQNGEVDILVNFRTPIDINQGTGLYDFGGKNSTAPVIQFSGLYMVQTVTNIFNQGKFTQKLRGTRRPQQENKTESTPSQLFSITKNT